jgi:ATP-dependent Clp protease ATP-binding subunit ClpC
VNVDPPTEEQTVEILNGLRDKYEAHHRVTYTDEALSGAVDLSNRYISGRFLPDKAIDVIDEAGAACALGDRDRPPDLRTIEPEIDELVKEKERPSPGPGVREGRRLRDQA